MALNQHLYPGAVSTNTSTVLIAGKVAIGSTGAVGAATGKGFVVTRTGVGRYSITLSASSGVPAILWADVKVVFATATNTQAAFLLTLAESTGVVTAVTVDSGTQDTAADPPSGSFLSFAILVKNNALAT